MTSSSSSPTMRLDRKVRLTARIWWFYLRSRRSLRHEPLPAFVDRFRDVERVDRPRLDPRRLSWIVHRALRLGEYRPRCLFGALVLFRLLREQGDEPEIVIGLPEEPDDERAHAWVELDGAVIGPLPGRLGHVEIARYG